MRVVDTSAWIEWLVGSPLGKRLGREIPVREQCIVPTLVQLEPAKWLTRETDEVRTDQVIAYTQKVSGITPVKRTVRRAYNKSNKFIWRIETNAFCAAWRPTERRLYSEMAVV